MSLANPRVDQIIDTLGLNGKIPIRSSLEQCSLKIAAAAETASLSKCSATADLHATAGDDVESANETTLLTDGSNSAEIYALYAVTQWSFE